MMDFKFWEAMGVVLYLAAALAFVVGGLMALASSVGWVPVLIGAGVLAVWLLLSALVWWIGNL